MICRNELAQELTENNKIPAFERELVMKKTQVKEEVLKMRFEDIYGRYEKRELSVGEAAELLGIHVRTFLRKRVRYEAEGFEGLYDRRLGKASPHRAAEAEVIQIIKNKY